MVNTKILISVIIVALIGVAAAGYQISSTTPGLWQPTDPANPQEQQSTGQSSQQSIQTQSGTQGGTSGGSQSGNGGSNVKITPGQAKSIAQKSIEEPGVTAGTPELVTRNGTKIYIVPVMDNSKQVGEFEIDAQTGKIIGGAGGAP